MNLVAALLAGLVIGYGLAQYQFSTTTKTLSNLVLAQKPPPIQIEQKVELPQSEKMNSRQNAEPNDSDTPSESNRAPASVETEATTPASVPQHLNLSITGEVLERLEDDWDDLPNQIRLVREQNGWRVAFLESYSLFSRIGLRMGDLITDESLKAMRYNAETVDFHERLLILFHHITSGN